MLFRKNIHSSQKEFQKHICEDLLPAYRKNITNNVIPFAILIDQPTIIVEPVIVEPIDIATIHESNSFIKALYKIIK